MKRLSTTILSWLLVAALALQSGLPAPVARAAADLKPPEANGWVQVSTAEQLIYIDQHQDDYVTRNIRLMNDIALPSGYSWIPIGGNGTDYFSGTLDGNGHLISGIRIDDSPLEFVGFMGVVSGNIRNVGVDVEISGGTVAGGLVGYLNGGSVERSYSTGSVTGARSPSGTAVQTGGLAGGAVNSSIVRSFSTAAVTGGSHSNMFAGGLVGSQGAGAIRDSYASGAVSAVTPHDIEYYNAAGLAGQVVYGTIANSYATGRVTATDGGGSVGNIVSGLAASMYVGASATGTYFDTESTGQAQGVASSDSGSIEAEGRTSALMKQAATYADWDFGEVWAISPDVNDGYPYLRPVILTDALPNARKGASYSLPLAAFDGAGGGLTWSVGGLPDGLTADSSGVIQGTAETGGTFRVTVTATDAGAAAAQGELTLVVDEEAPDLAGFAVHPGGAYGTTKATAVPSGPDSEFAYALGDTAGARPLLGAPLPGGAIAYVPGEDIEAVGAGQYLQIYEVDAGHSIRAWSSVRLAPEHVNANVPVTGVKLEPDSLTLTAGEAGRKLTAVVEPADATNSAVLWSSSDSGVAAVDAAGEVTPVAAGTAVVTAATVDGGYAASATVTVRPAPAGTGTVTGAVYGVGNEPLPGATVSIAGKVGATGSTGSFVLTDVPAGVRTVAVAAAGHADYAAEANVIAGETVDIGAVYLTPIDPPGEPGNPDSPGDPESPGSPDPDPPSDPEPPSKPGRPRPAGAGQRPAAGEPGTVSVTINGATLAITASQETDSAGRAVLRLTLDAELLSRLFASDGEVVLAVDSSEPIVKLDMPLAAVRAIAAERPDSRIQLQAGRASYRLPLRVWDDSAGAVATIAIAQASRAVARELNAALTARGYTMLAAPVDFALYADEREMAYTGGIYTERTLPLDDAARTEHYAVVWIDAAGRPHFIPSKRAGDSGAATFYAPHNSMYTAVASDRTFADVQGHWAQRDIETLANKLIVLGGGEGGFAPDSPITRAEWTAMLVRSLGLGGLSGPAYFTDVRTEAWYAEAVGAARLAGVVEGYADGMLRPNAPVSREEAAVMLMRAMTFAGRPPRAAEAATALERYADRAAVADWAAEPMRQLLVAGIVEGDDRGRLAPEEAVTRAQGAVLLKRMLEYLAFID